MLFNIMCLLLIVLIALYLATQGLLSAMLALVTATFSSILAMGLMEAFQGPLVGYSANSARGLTFLALFLVVFVVTRVGADMLVPQNIKLPFFVNRIAGGAVGFFAALVIMGSMINGIEMLPLGTSLMGYDRFPGDKRMEGDTAGAIAAPSNIWFAPERVTLAIWNGASGRALGGARPFASVHPDLSVESYGYRNTVVYAANHVLPKDLLEVRAGWQSSDPKVYQPLGIPVPTDPGKKIVMVRTSVQRGKGDHDSADVDGVYFRITPTEVRLVTDKAHQYYPIGHLDRGTSFEPLPLDTAALADDFPKSGSVIEDWIFEVNDDEKAQFIEVKELARADVSGVVKSTMVPALAANQYPQKAYQKDASTINVTMTAPDPIVEGNIYLLRSTITSRDAHSQILAGYQHALDIINDTTGAWTPTGKPGVPPSQIFGIARRFGLDLENKGTNDSIETGKALQIIMVAPFTPDGQRNLIEVPRFITETVIPMMNGAEGSRGVLSSTTIGPSGTATITKVPKGGQTVLATLKTSKGFYYWITDQNVAAKSTITLTFNTKDAQVSIVP